MENDNNCVPKLTNKEFLALRDQLDAEKLTIEKFQQYEAEMDDPELKKMCKDMVNLHKNHYNTLVKHLNC